MVSIFSRNVRNVCPLRHLPTLTKLRTLRTLPTLREGGNQELYVERAASRSRHGSSKSRRRRRRQRLGGRARHGGRRRGAGMRAHVQSDAAAAHHATTQVVAERHVDPRVRTAVEARQQQRYHHRLSCTAPFARDRQLGFKTCRGKANRSDNWS